MTLTFELHLDMIEMNQQAKHLGQRSLGSQVIVQTPPHTHTDSHTRLYLDN